MAEGIGLDPKRSRAHSLSKRGRTLSGLPSLIGGERRIRNPTAFAIHPLQIGGGTFPLHSPNWSSRQAVKLHFLCLRRAALNPVGLREEISRRGTLGTVLLPKYPSPSPPAGSRLLCWCIFPVPDRLIRPG